MSTEVCMRIAGRDYNQDQVASIAFNTYYHSGRNTVAGLQTWKNIVGDRDFKEKDYAFLLLYFLEHVAPDDVKEVFEDDIPRIKRALA